MEERKNVFNITSQMFEAKAVSLFEDLYDILTDTLSSDENFEEKNKNFESSLLGLDTLKINLITEKAYEFCKNNKNKGYTYDDNGIALVDFTDLEDIMPIQKVFVNLYQYMLFASYYNQFKEKLVKKVLQENDELNSEVVEKAITACNLAVTEDSHNYSFDEMEDLMLILGSTYQTAFNIQPRGQKKASDYAQMLLADLSLPQFNKLVFYVESLCDLINHINHNPEIYVDQLGYKKENSKFNPDYVEIAFAIRNILEAMQEELYKDKDLIKDIDAYREQQRSSIAVSPRTRDKEESN